MTSPADPFQWWHSEGWRPPVMTDVLYRRDEWVTTFLRHLDTELARSRLTSVRLEPRREALVVTGQAGPETLRTARATYRDILLFHPALQRDVEALLDEAVEAAAAECTHRNFVKADDLRRSGRALLLDNPSLLLHPDVAAGLRGLKLSGLPPLGVSGVVELQSNDGTYVVAALRSDRVAVNPGCLGPCVDGGLGSTGTVVDPKAALRHEIRDELPWQFDDDELRLVGTLLPPAAPTAVGRRFTRRCGVNVVYRVSLDREPDEVLADSGLHFEAAELALVKTSGRRSSSELPSILVRRRGELTEMTDVPPLSEVLAAVLARREVVEVSVDRARHVSSFPKKKRSKVEADLMVTNSSAARELTLEDAWAENLVERHSRLHRVLNPERLSDLSETFAAPSMETIEPIIDAVREFEFLRSGDQVKAADEARLFEALVYRITRYLFDNDENRALLAHDLMLPRAKDRILEEGEELNPIGSAYTRRLDDVLNQDEKEDPDGVWRDAVSSALRSLNQSEAVQEYAEVARRGRLLSFCAALWCLESKHSPAAAMVALEDAYRKSLSGDVIALFFRARALLVSPVLSAAQAQLGLQFVTSALATYGHNPGMHHTKAIFLLRQSALTEIEIVSRHCLEQALESIETALEWDAEFPKFYTTRAKVKYRLKDRAGALIDIRAGIELARYSASSPMVRREVAEWEALLDTWQLAPVGDPDSG